MVNITPDALERVLEVRAKEPDSADLALWVEVAGVSGNAFTYDMAFLRREEIDPTDLVAEQDGLTVVWPAHCASELDGATIAVDPQLGGGLVIENPNTPSPAFGAAPDSLSGTVQERVAQVIAYHINPAIASHGGACALVGVEGDAAMVQLMGGCQGCGMSRVTLQQGIETAILSSVPEITRVVDVTDHAAGTSPFYAPVS